jgi:hypothetical protein
MIRLVLGLEKIIFVSRGELTCVEFCCLLVGLVGFSCRLSAASGRNLERGSDNLSHAI